MMARHRWLHPVIPLALALGVSTVLLAAVRADPFDGAIGMEPMASDTVQIDWTGRIIVSATLNCWAIAGTTDASPNGMVVAGPTAIGGQSVTFKLSPTTTRTGKIYQCRMQATDANGNTPTANVRIEVRKVSLG